ncbi:hypothetical protein P43SY_008941 [Pythium insidiosum]|uniref:Uncharacterized protein n=1 Tax=Pythium insidiosum TaxID=114742 RepID=A0AAD5QAD4_PYTIN|nr:hypothetical protein P43SY_008941 [Pythium insidiosum]
MAAIREANVASAKLAAARTKRQCLHLRKLYDHMEGEADRALRRRKQIRKATHLHIHEEIERLKQESYHRKVRQALAQQLRGSPLFDASDSALSLSNQDA